MNEITLINPANNLPLQITKDGLQDSAGNFFPYIKGAYRFVADDNYTGNFGYQWNKFATTQIDKTASINLSQVRFFAETNWDKEDLAGKNVLEVGSGAGRFSQIVIDCTKANLYSVDYSNAVEANFKNNGPNNRLHLFQASIYEMPFQKNSFDKVFCFGVLQHTPDVKKSVMKLIEMAKPGAEVVVDFYPINGWWTKIHAKYILRPYTKKMDHKQLFEKIDRNADRLIKGYRFFKKIGLGKLGIRFLPICDIDGTLPKNISKEKLREMVVLDTFDMFSPEYDQPQKISTVVNWFKEFGMTNVWGGTIVKDGFKASVVKGIKM
ncbi:MAG: class I SAM-dependent methyltransferase [Bacteroidetes bacterium]|nr:class I SAM-dependent methyltransferase [Bacteroidota bacterium]MBS1758116.1 class I SAM-dependent methyltransferase [Bacteroidota bacterium]